YNGARTAFLLRNVRIEVKDVGRSGIVPGAGMSSGRPRRPGEKDDGPRPGVVQSDGPMRVDLPRPRPRVVCGPPVASEPTIVVFARNARARQGDPRQPDQCDADLMHLTLVPTEDLPAPPQPT